MANNRPTRGGGTLNGYKILSIVLAALLAAVAIVELVLWRLDYIVFQNPNTQEQTAGAEDGLVLTPGGSEYMSLDVTRAAAANGAGETITLTATIEPADATDKTVDWAVAFVNPSSAWASGKTVTDYVTVTPTKDGALTAVVACLKQFGEQIKITVTSRSAPEISAVCTADYQQKVESWSAMVMGADFKSFQLQKSNETVHLTGYLLLGSGASAMFSSCKLSTAYTLSGRDYNYRAIEMSLTNEAKTALQSAGVTLSSNESTLIWESEWDAVGSSVNMDGIHDKFTEIFFIQPDLSKLSSAFDAAAYDVNFRLIFGNDSGSEVEVYEEYNYQVNLNLDFFARSVNGIELDEDTIVF